MFFVFFPVFFYFILIITFSFFYKKKKLAVKGNEEYRYYVSGLTLKLLGGFLFACVYTFYYEVGDTFEYYKSGLSLYKFFAINPEAILKAFFSSTEGLKNYGFKEQYGNFLYILPGGRDMPFYYQDDFFLMSKIVFLMSFIPFSNYFTVTLFYSFFSFLGVWKIFKVFTKIYPEYTRYFAISIFYVPSIFFWGSGLMKDSITICMVGLILESLFKLFFLKRNIFLNTALLLCAGYILFILKAYILITFVPAAVIWLFRSFNKSISNSFIRIIIAPITIFLFFVSGYFLLTYISSFSDKYSMSKVVATAEGFQSYHSSLEIGDGGGSFYTLGDMDYSPIGVVKKIPAALNVTFFRPYLWEIHSVVMGISALESLCILLFSLFSLIKIKISPLIKIIASNPEAILCLTFSVLLGFSVGFTSFNFGALARYKIPSLMFFLIYFVITIGEYNKRKTKPKAVSKNKNYKARPFVAR